MVALLLLEVCLIHSRRDRVADLGVEEAVADAA